MTPAEEQAAGHPSKSSSKDLQETRMKDSTAAAEQIAETTTTPDTPSKLSHLATPAVRGLLKELRVNIEQVTGTGRDGRVMKEDVRKFAADPDGKPTATGPSKSPRTINHGPQQETSTSLTPIQHAMFKSMTKSLSIPHFLYGDEVDLTSLTTLRTQLNNHPTTINKLSSLSFIIKAVSIALQDFPLINARVEVSENGESPKLVIRSQHNIGVAMDTPQGLLVPNIKNVATLTIPEIAEQLIELHTRAKASKLTSTDLSGGTITVSNIGSIGGTYVAPIIVQSELAILGVGKSRLVPAFDDVGMVVKKTVGNFSWSADHRVIDGATMARMGERVRTLIEEPALMITNLR